MVRIRLSPAASLLRTAGEGARPELGQTFKLTPDQRTEGIRRRNRGEPHHRRWRVPKGGENAKHRSTRSQTPAALSFEPLFAGRLMLTVLGGLAEFERELIRARTGEGRERAKARGQSLGRPFKLTPHQRSEAIRRRDRGETLSDIARSYNVHPSTISRLTV
jgi:hypothetical protein